MKYKEYNEEIEYSEKDKCFIGTVLGLSDVIIFEGSSVKELESAFKSSVDNYLALCKKLNKDPEKTYNGRISKMSIARYQKIL